MIYANTGRMFDAMDADGDTHRRIGRMNVTTRQYASPTVARGRFYVRTHEGVGSFDLRKN